MQARRKEEAQLRELLIEGRRNAAYFFARRSLEDNNVYGFTRVKLNVDGMSDFMRGQTTFAAARPKSQRI